MNSIPNNFDLNCEYLQQVNFNTDLSYLTKEFDARLWLRELVMSAQTNTAPPPMLLMLIITMILISLPVTLDYVLSKLEDEYVEKPNNYWFYNGTIMCFNFIFYLANLLFLNVSYTDANRRNYMMQKLS